MQNLSVLALPLLRFNEKHIISIKSKYWLQTMSKSFFDNGGFKHTTYFLDFNLNYYKIIRTSKSRLSYNLVDIIGWIENKYRYQLKYELSIPVQLSFYDARQIIVDLILRNRWYAQGGETKAEFLQAFESHSSMQELISSISAYGDPPF
jgi:hypothetical protein